VGDYVLDITSLTALNALGTAPSFSEVDRFWTILTASSIDGFNAANWTVNPGNFSNNDQGDWSLAQSDNSLVLSYTAIPEPGVLVLLGVGVLLVRLGLRRRR
jgi:hypothetical protein